VRQGAQNSTERTRSAVYIRSFQPLPLKGSPMVLLLSGPSPNRTEAWRTIQQLVCRRTRPALPLPTARCEGMQLAHNRRQGGPVEVATPETSTAFTTPGVDNAPDMSEHTIGTGDYTRFP
jgi:hypothetical protein